MAKTGFLVLVGSEVLSVLVSLAMLMSPSVVPDPWLRSGGSEVLIRAWGVTWLAFSAVLLAVLFTSFRRAERWAWLVMVSVPLLWLTHFLLAPETLHNLILAIITCLALAVTYRFRFTQSARNVS